MVSRSSVINPMYPKPRSLFHASKRLKSLAHVSVSGKQPSIRANYMLADGPYARHATDKVAAGRSHKGNPVQTKHARSATYTLDWRLGRTSLGEQE
jgi:hypothetical protein